MRRMAEAQLRTKKIFKYYLNKLIFRIKMKKKKIKVKTGEIELN